MEDDFEISELWPIGEIADHLPPPPRGSHAVSKVYSWLNLANDPTRKTLRTVTLGRYRYCSDQWVREFFGSSKPSAKPAPTPNQRQRQRDRAKKELQEAGI